MDIEKEAKKQTKTTSFLEMPTDGDLSLRLRKLSEQTGLSSCDLLQKWILQEESLIGVMRHSGRHAAKSGIPEGPAPRRASGAKKQKKTPKTSPDDLKHRKMLVKKAAKLKKEGMTLVKIAEIFNGENLSTVSGKGKWYSSSVAVLLKSKTK
jgi:hypothetical protein